MKINLTTLLVLCLLLAVLGGCTHGYVIKTAGNDKRHISIYNAPKLGNEAKLPPDFRVCMEPTTNVLLNRQVSVQAAIPVSNSTATELGTNTLSVSPTLTVANQSSMAKAYEVSEILQLAHTSMYRLCEARGNGDLMRDEYEEYFGETLTMTGCLLRDNATQGAIETLATGLRESAKQWLESKKDIAGNEAKQKAIVEEAITAREAASKPPKADKVCADTKPADEAALVKNCLPEAKANSYIALLNTIKEAKTLMQRADQDREAFTKQLAEVKADKGCDFQEIMRSKRNDATSGKKAILGVIREISGDLVLHLTRKRNLESTMEKLVEKATANSRSAGCAYASDRSKLVSQCLPAENGTYTSLQDQLKEQEKAIKDLEAKRDGYVEQLRQKAPQKGE